MSSLTTTTVLTLDKLVALTKALKQNQHSRPIEFKKTLTKETMLKIKPKQWDNLMCLGKAPSQQEYDLILAWDDSSTNGKVVYLGHWNDGVVE